MPRWRYSIPMTQCSYHAGEKGLCICGGFGLMGGVTTLINPWPGFCSIWRALSATGGLPRDDGVCGLGTLTLRGPVTQRFVATKGGLWASLKLSDRRDIPPSERREPSDSLDIPSCMWWCGWGWWSIESWWCNRGGWRTIGSGNLEKYKFEKCYWFSWGEFIYAKWLWWVKFNTSVHC